MTTLGLSGRTPDWLIPQDTEESSIARRWLAAWSVTSQTGDQTNHFEITLPVTGDAGDFRRVGPAEQGIIRRLSRMSLLTRISMQVRARLCDRPAGSGAC
jgi:hypothetical protein